MAWVDDIRMFIVHVLTVGQTLQQSVVPLMQATDIMNLKQASQEN